MDSILSQNDVKKEYTTGPSESYPRSFHPVHTGLSNGMESPLPSSIFSLIPPTPRNPLDRPRPVSDSFAYSMANEYSGSSVTSSPWEHPHSASPDSHSLGTSTADMSSYGSPIDAQDIYRPRYDTMPRYLEAEDCSGPSSYSSSGMLDPTYQYSTTSDYQHHAHEGLSLNTNMVRRISDAHSSISVASTDAIADGLYDRGDDASSYNGSTYGDAHQTPLSMTTTTSNTPLSPPMGGSPLSHHYRSGSHGPSNRNRTSPSPSLNREYRHTPYDKQLRWSTGNSPYAQPSPSPFNNPIDPQLHGGFPSTHSSPVCPPSHPPPAQYFLPSHTHAPPPPLLGNSYMMMLPSSSPADGPYVPGYAEYSDPPDLYLSSREEHIPPPPEDLDPADPEMKPHEQDLRFDGDLYTPRWVRGHGNKREGWCGLCKPGRWLVLKNSAFWYDKSFTHGISAATGTQFTEPREMRRMDGNPDMWEGLCHSCQDWVPLVSNKKKGTTWFRHAYKCHTHPKIKDAPKRRRESSQGKKKSHGHSHTASGCC